MYILIDDDIVRVTRGLLSMPLSRLVTQCLFSVQY